MMPITPVDPMSSMRTSVRGVNPQVTPVPATTVRRPTIDATAFVARRAGTGSIREGFATMQSRFLPAEAKGFDARFQFRLSGPGGGTWFVVIKDGTCTVKAGEGTHPDTTLSASAADYLKIVNGEMNKIVALLRRKLRVDGDMGKVRRFFGCFRKQ